MGEHGVGTVSPWPGELIAEAEGDFRGPAHSGDCVETRLAASARTLGSCDLGVFQDRRILLMAAGAREAGGCPGHNGHLVGHDRLLGAHSGVHPGCCWGFWGEALAEAPARHARWR